MKWLLTWTIGLTLLGAAGCGVDSGDTSTGGGGSGGSGGGSPCDDPAFGPVPEECGVWVSASLGDDSNPGTQAAPVASLVHAVELAAKGAGHVYACVETWTDPLVIPGHVGLHGGFDCENGWAYLSKDERSMLVTPPDQIALIVSGEDDGGQATVTDFYIEAASASKSGGSSLAVFVRDNVPLLLQRCEIVAGDGGDGLDGASYDLPAEAGPPGKGGADACASGVSFGGMSPVAACPPGLESKGGAGGDATLMTAANGGDGEPAIGPPGDGAGGLGEQSAPACTDGKPGTKGPDGAYGMGGLGFDPKPSSGKGRLSIDGYVGMDGEDGQSGTPGQGGGGGGATLGSAAVCGATPGGAAGGSGGAGGCGGKGGGGGQAGGASIGVGLRNRLGLFNTHIQAGNGGNGGNGGFGQPGGTGGAGAPGGAGKSTIKPGCGGGDGGHGGNGGRGGGGMGGPSHPIAVAIALFDGGWVLADDNTNSLDTGEGGEGGKGEAFKDDSYGYVGGAAPVAFLEP